MRVCVWVAWVGGGWGGVPKCYLKSFPVDILYRERGEIKPFLSLILVFDIESPSRCAVKM